VKFEKWQALGNDYLIVEQADLPWELTPARVAALCAPHTGVGGDGVLLLARPAASEHVADLRIFNPDGSEAELSGNGAREAIMYLRHSGWTGEDRFAITTAAGTITPTITGPSTCRVQMGRASLSSEDFPSGGADGRGALRAGGREWEFQHVSVGNPQCAIAVEERGELEALVLERYGPEIEHSALFPRRTNVSWFTPLDDTKIRARIFERGVGETLASGTGATGAAIAHLRRGGTSPVRVLLDGGELDVEIDPNLNVTLTGWAVPVFRGELSDEFLKELHETE
jgi:diaminopimelate epimerase